MENKRIVLAVVLSAIVLFGWNYLFPHLSMIQPAPKAVTQPKPEAKAPETAAAPALDRTSALTFTPSDGRSVNVKTPNYSAVFSPDGGVLEQFNLLSFAQGIEPGSPPVDLAGSGAVSKAPLGLILDGAPAWRDVKWTLDGADLDLKPGQSGTLSYSGQMGELRLKRVLTFYADTFFIDDKVSIANLSKNRLQPRLAFTLAERGMTATDDKYNPTRTAYYAAEGLNEESGDKLKEGIVADKGLKWGAIESNYFLLALVPGEEGASLKIKLEDQIYRLAVEKSEAIEPGAEATLSCTYFLGPKDMKLLETAPNDLKKVINYGWFDFIAKPLILLLHFFYTYVGNYGVAIILLTMLIKLVFWPLSQKSYNSMNQMKKLQPMMADIREKYKDDRQKMNEEMMRLYKTYKVNPAGGCVPMLVQIPVFFGLYQALLNAIELRHASFIMYLPFTDKIWLADLAAKDPYYITPLIMGATMFLQQKMTPAPGDPTQAKVMLLMPVIFTFMFLNFPAGLVVYWLVNNVLSISQQWWMMHDKKK